MTPIQYLIEQFEEHDHITNLDLIYAKQLEQNAAKEHATQFADWLLTANHPYTYNDAFCIGEHHNKWHDDDGTFLTTEEMYELFLQHSNK